MDKNDKQEKEKKAGHPIFIIVIFVVLLGFLFILPEVYKKFNTEISSFLGIGSHKEETIEEEYKDPVSSYFEINSTGTLKYNEITISKVNLSHDKMLTFNVSSESKIDLEELDYYVEFYRNKNQYIGRRTLKGIVDGTIEVSLDLSGLDVNNGSYMVISHIDAIPPYESDTDESGLSTIICKKDNISYQYDFGLKKLYKVTKKYNFIGSNLEEYGEALLEAQKEDKKLNELVGVNSSIVEDGYSFMTITEFDYEEISSFRIEDPYLFKKDTYNNIIHFKMDAEGFECE